MDTLRGLAFLLSALVMLVAVARVAAERRSRVDLRAFLAKLCCGVSVIALVHRVLDLRTSYGIIDAGQNQHAYGPFWNRNHFAAFVGLTLPFLLERLVAAAAKCAKRRRPGLRGWVILLGDREGTALTAWSLAAFTALAALASTNSRAGTTAFVLQALVLALAFRGRGTALLAVLVGVGFAIPIYWLGPQRLLQGLARLFEDAPGRTVVWVAALERWLSAPLLGTGFNSFPTAVPQWISYPAAHNQYVQILLETGIIGLTLTVWAVVRVLWAARFDPWVLAALAAVLAHASVEFHLQIPALALVAACVTGLAAPPPALPPDRAR